MTDVEVVTPDAVIGPRWQEYMPLDELLQRRDPRNAKLHDEAGISASMDRHGYVEAITLDERTGLLISGHGRVERLEAKHDAGDEPPEGIVADDNGRWYVPTDRGWSSADDDEAEAALVGVNALTIAGGWDARRLHEQLTRQSARPAGFAGMGFVADDIRRVKAQIDRQQIPSDGAPDESAQLNPHFSILIECTDEQQQTTMLQTLIADGVTCRALLL